MKTVYLILFSLLFAFVYGQSTQVTQCTRTNAPLPLNTYVEGCTTPPCILLSGTDAILNIVFTAPHTIHKMTTYAYAFLSIIPINYGLGEDAVTCNYLTNTYCPLMAGEIVQYTLRMHIEEIFPAISVNIEFHIEDENNTPITCFRAPMTVVKTLRSNGTMAITEN